MTAAIEIAGLPGLWTLIPRRYEYSAAPTRCPYCEHHAGGAPWAGWFSCELCGCVALVSDGRAFVSPTMKVLRP